MEKLDMNKELEALKKLWECNEELLKNINGEFTRYFKRNSQKKLTEWEFIASRGFHIALNKFKAIQFLMNPNVNENFYMESASLARNLWEIWLILTWLDHPDVIERKRRIDQLKKDSIINLDNLNRSLKEVINSTESDDIQWVAQEAQKIKEQLPKGKKWKMPTKLDYMKSIASTDERFSDSITLYYNVVYRDFCEYVHFSRRTIEEISCSMTEEEIEIIRNPDLGFKCLDVSGGFFVFTTEIFNKTLNATEETLLKEWFDKWLKVQTETRKVLSHIKS